MRGDQPVCAAASETWAPVTAHYLNTFVSRFARAGPPVGVLEANDVVEVRCGDLEDRGVVERGDPVHGAGRVAEAGAGGDDLGVQDGGADGAELELRPAALDVPALVLLAVELEAERLAGADEEDLADVRAGMSPDQLPPPRLLHAPRFEAPAVAALEVGRVDAHPCRTGFQSGCAAMNSSARRRSFGVFTVSHTPWWRCPRSFPSAASSGNVVCSWSPRSGSRASAS